MVWRATEDDVRNVLEDDFPSDIRLAQNLTTANTLTNKVTARDSAGLLNAADLKDIEIYLAGHFAVMRAFAIAQENTAGAGASVQGAFAFGKGFDATYWGATAMRLDETGFLKKLNDEKKTTQATMQWWGQTREDQTSDADRND